MGFGIFAILTTLQTHTKPVIGILQTASHPALDLSREGFIEGLGDEFELRIQNAEGLISQAQIIANNFHRDPNIKAIYTIATPATQVMIHTESEKPIIFSAVTDPSVLGISHKQSNVTGCRDLINVKKQIDLLEKLCPKVKTLALLFNPSEVNSVILSDIMRKELKGRGLNSIDVGIYTEADITTAMRKACTLCDAIIAPTDNLVATTISQIVRISKEQKIPLIVSDNLLVEKGALAACGVNYYDSGKQAAALVKNILLKGKRPSDLPISIPQNDKIIINEKTAQYLGISTKDVSL